MMPKEMESILAEVKHSLAVEHMVMIDEEKEDLRRAGRGEISFQDLVTQYVNDARRTATLNA